MAERVRQGVADAVVQNQVGQLFGPEHGVAGNQVGPDPVLNGGQPDQGPVSGQGGSAGGRGQSDGMLDGPDPRQGVGLDLHGTHLVHEGLDRRETTGASSVLEEPHERVQTVIGLLPLLGGHQGPPLPVIGQVQAPPGLPEHVLGLTVLQGADAAGGQSQNLQGLVQDLNVRILPATPRDGGHGLQDDPRGSPIRVQNQ